MRTIYIATLLPAAGYFVICGAALCQNVEIPKEIMDKLQSPQQAEARKITVVPAAEPRFQSSAADIAHLLAQVESIRGAPSGTIRAIDSKGGTISIQYDLPKVHETFGKPESAPFGKGRSDFRSGSKNKTVSIPVLVEYRVKDTSDYSEKVVSIKSITEVAANASASGNQPLSLKVNNADLSATQIPGAETQLSVNVVVGREARRMKVGEVSRFGKIEVTILTSSNYSTKASREGPPYSLRLLVMPVQ
jgi:hypothetical protein